MNRSETGLTDEPGTLPLGSSDPTERLGGAPGPRLVLDRYRLEQRLGAGGFGVVWQAWDEKLEREVAVKAIPRERGGGERVEREALAAARLNHPAIVGIYELASDEHDVYLVSELVRGRTLAELLSAGALSDRDAARIGADLCEALAHAHTRGVIHRDVKPQNVIVVAEPAAGVGFAKLTDFGVAHLVQGDALTRTGDVVGTLAYMAPEQAEGARVTPACDVYSLALTLYETWSGQNPVRAAGPAATARRLGKPLPSLSRMRRDLPLELCDAIDDALEPDPGVRPAPAELRAELRAAQAELTDEGGLVEPETLRRVGLPSTDSRRGLFRRGARAQAPNGPPPAAGGPEDPRPATQPTGLLGRAGASQPASKMVRLAQRAAAGLLAGALVLAVLSSLGPEPAFSKLSAAAVAAGATALLPRIGWMLSVLGLCVWLVAPETDRQGTAVVLAAAALPIPFLLPRAGLLWSVPILCPLLGTIALAPAFIGVAALAPTPWRRAGLAAAGVWWLVLGEALTGKPLLFGSPDGTLPRADWEGSISAALSDVLVPLAGSPALAPLLVWAAFAVALPFVVRGRWLAVDLAGAGVWALALIVAMVALGDALAAEVALDQARGAVAGSIAAALVALSVSQIVAPAEGWRAPRVTTA
ncbi:MAG TPA: serine/threonine-protein kinase [Thermoleophilaceae bacterium]|jgi:eukaryotic-like serine/threonine-protein kinase|nr:serine/threonine-protein kinase [Thermoleophilaceae bacterium]